MDERVDWTRMVQQTASYRQADPGIGPLTARHAVATFPAERIYCIALPLAPPTFGWRTCQARPCISWTIQLHLTVVRG